MAAGAPATATFVTGLLLTVTLVSTGVVDADSLARWASTNIANLHRHPLSALVLSAFVLSGPAAVNIATTALACGALERRVGARRMLMVAAAGQVIPSLVTEGAVRLSIRAGAESMRAAWRFDVGISYVMFAVIAAATRYAPARWRRLVLAGGIVISVAQLAALHDMTASGHALAYGIGLTCWPLLDRHPVRDRARTWARRSLLAAAVVGLAAIYLPLAAFGIG